MTLDNHCRRVEPGEGHRDACGPAQPLRPDAVKRLVDSVGDFQARSREIAAEMRTLSTTNAEEIRVAVEDGKQRLARLAQRAEG